MRFQTQCQLQADNFDHEQIYKAKYRNHIVIEQNITAEIYLANDARSPNELIDNLTACVRVT